MSKYLRYLNAVSRTGSSYDKSFYSHRLQLLKLRRQRLWIGLVAEAQDGRAAGYSLLSLQQPLAVLPPPFPSTSPLFLHLDALAVEQSQRKRGVGTALLDASERIGEEQLTLNGIDSKLRSMISFTSLFQ